MIYSEPTTDSADCETARSPPLLCSPVIASRSESDEQPILSLASLTFIIKKDESKESTSQLQERTFTVAKNKCMESMLEMKQNQAVLESTPKFELNEAADLDEVSKLSFKLRTCKEIINLYENNLKMIDPRKYANPCKGNCETAIKLKCELNQADEAYDELLLEYTQLYDMYGKITNKAYEQKAALLNQEGAISAQQNSNNELKQKFIEERKTYTAFLERASLDMDSLLAKHEKERFQLNAEWDRLKAELNRTMKQLADTTKEAEDVKEVHELLTSFKASQQRKSTCGP